MYEFELANELAKSPFMIGKIKEFIVSFPFSMDLLREVEGEKTWVFQQNVVYCNVSLYHMIEVKVIKYCSLFNSKI